MPLDAGISEDIVDPKDAAEYAGLTYVSDGGAGIRRKTLGKGFSYVNASGAKVDDPAVLAYSHGSAEP